MASLTAVPHEVLHCILASATPEDLGRLSQTCRTLGDFIYGNRLLFKAVYLRHFDDPRRDGDAEEPKWDTILPATINAIKVLNSDNSDIKHENLKSTINVIDSLLSVRHTSPSRNVKILKTHFENAQNLESFMCKSSLFSRVDSATADLNLSTEEKQLSAKLHCLHGVPIDHPGRLRSERCPKTTHPFARSRVYDLREYTDDSFWGPFMDDGSGDVDWEKMEAIMVVLGFNLRIIGERMRGQLPPIWAVPFDGLLSDSFPTKRYNLKEEDLANAELVERSRLANLDPYNVTGTWMRIVCFLDYGDLYAYNFGPDMPPDGTPLEPIEYEEAIRLIIMTLHVTSIEEPGPEDGQELPVVHFRGTSRSMHAAWDPNANSDIRDGWHTIGSVRQTKQGEIRWTTFSIYHGEEVRWRSESVQPGGIRSARGSLGNWFDKDYSEHGPAGPTAFWKINNDLPRPVKRMEDNRWREALSIHIIG